MHFYSLDFLVVKWRKIKNIRSDSCIVELRLRRCDEGLLQRTNKGIEFGLQRISVV